MNGCAQLAWVSRFYRLYRAASRATRTINGFGSAGLLYVSARLGVVREYSDFIIYGIIRRVTVRSDNPFMKFAERGTTSLPTSEQRSVAPSSGLIDSLATSGQIPESLDEAVALYRDRIEDLDHARVGTALAWAEIEMTRLNLKRQGHEVPSVGYPLTDLDSGAVRRQLDLALLRN